MALGQQNVRDIFLDVIFNDDTSMIKHKENAQFDGCR